MTGRITQASSSATRLPKLERCLPKPNPASPLTNFSKKRAAPASAVGERSPDHLTFMPEQNDIIDTAFKRLESLLAEVEQFGDTLFTESDTRIKIIDTMLIEILGWQKADILTEEQAGKGFSRLQAFH